MIHLLIKKGIKMKFWWCMMNSNASVVLKSLFKVKRHGFEDEQAKMERYVRYIEKMTDEKYGLIQELHALCFENPSINADVQELVNKLHELVCGDVNG